MALGVRRIESVFEMQTVYGWSTTHMGGAASTEYLVERLRCAAGTRVLDLGSGAGQAACLLAHRFGCPVVGLDLSAVHVATARRRAKQYRLGNVAFIQGDAARLPFPDGAFDRVLVESMLSLTPDAAAVLTEVRRVLRPGGYVAVNEAASGPGLPPPVPTKRMRAAGYRHFQPRSPAQWRALLLAAGLRVDQLHASPGVPIRDAPTLRWWAQFLVSRWLRLCIRHAREPRRWLDGLLFFDLVRSFALRRTPFILALASAPPAPARQDWEWTEADRPGIARTRKRTERAEQPPAGAGVAGDQAALVTVSSPAARP